MITSLQAAWDHSDAVFALVPEDSRDIEFPEHSIDVAAFEFDCHPATNRRWRDLLHDTGTPDALVPQPCGRADRGWNWIHLEQTWPLDAVEELPVTVSQQQANTFCEHHHRRLPTEAGLQRTAFTTPWGTEQSTPWGEGPPTADRGTFAFHTSGPSPVGSLPAGIRAWGVDERVGNGWEWTSTPFALLPGFAARARTYPGYSPDFFDDDHFVVFGDSLATDARLLLKSLRNRHLGHDPYAFTTLRTAA